MASSMMPWSKEPVTRLFTVADRCRNTSRRPGFTETEHCCRPLSREHCCRPVSSEDAPEDQLGHQLAPLKWAPFCACQAEQQRSRTQSCTGSLFCLPGEAATHLASTAGIQPGGHPARRHGTAQILAVSGVPRAGASCGATWQSM